MGFQQLLVSSELVCKGPNKKAKNVVDHVGCGIGGSSRYIASKFGAKCQGITLSPVQAQRANALAAAQGLSDKTSFQVADALEKLRQFEHMEERMATMFQQMQRHSSQCSQSVPPNQQSPTLQRSSGASHQETN